MAEGVVSVLLKKLCELIKIEAHLLARVKPDVKLLLEKLEWISLSLEEADNKCLKDKEIKLWVAQVRAAAFEAEDIIDQFVYEGKKNRIDRWIRLHNIGKKIQEINSSLDKISDNRSKLGIGNVQDKGEPSVPIMRKEKRSPRVEETNIVGIEDEVEKISKMMLIGGGARASVVSILGMGGLGKTTLATKLFNDKRIRRHFECYAWIYVSQEFMVRDLLYDLIKCIKTLSSDDIVKLKSMKEEELREELLDCLKGRHYFIVIDDIWSREAWDGIKASFPSENNGSRIMLTTRKKDVALRADPQSQPYELRLLTDEECWELLCKKALLGAVSEGNLEELEEAGRDIAKRCCGLPLAVVVIGGLLSRKEKSVYEWNKVRKSIEWHLKEGEDQILGILALSYNDLPYYLKMCFLYFAAFPEDSSIDATELFRLWVAEGFVQERGDETLEEVAEDYLLELIHRSLIQVTKRHFTGRVKKCRIHDLLRELAIKKAKEDLFLDVNSVKGHSASPTTARRLAITHHAICKHISVSCLNEQLRSLFFSAQHQEKFKRAMFKSLSSGGFKFLRVMQIANMHISMLPDGIGSLIFLRYLSITFKKQIKMLPRTFKKQIEMLPSTLYKLHNMQSLVIRTAFSCTTIPIHDGICEMTQLRHLDIYDGSFSPEAKHMRLNQLTNLQTLSFMKVDDWIGGDFDELTSLRSLGLYGNLEEYQTALSNFLGKQENLESLRLSVDSTHWIPTQITSSHLHHLEKLHLSGGLKKVPTLQNVAPNLTKLVLICSLLNDDPMAILEKLPKLKVLKLRARSYNGEKMYCSANGFPALVVFKVDGLEYLKDWTVEEGAIANLKRLEICRCGNLKMIPEGFRHVTTLQELVLRLQPPEFFERVQENGLDWFKIKHAPSVVIQR
ncbi:Disease resistance protein [Cinnamomum micranthum f. kanehirae]|uniref:Disease resistance protein n=1 Tax=Cinnamomum micranthum f. kanehirae TaxID=337451 RepID=A0A3S3QGR2_9MAGN|nr:Disease resistance protein [Cinnamomum micranthum f. kanehirae]